MKQNIIKESKQTYNKNTKYTNHKQKVTSLATFYRCNTPLYINITILA